MNLSKTTWKLLNAFISGDTVESSVEFCTTILVNTAVCHSKIKRVGGWDLSLEKSSWIGGWIAERVNVPYIMIAQLHLGSIS